MILKLSVCHNSVLSCQADAFLLAIAGGPDLLARIQARYFEKSKSNVARVCHLSFAH